MRFFLPLLLLVLLQSVLAQRCPHGWLMHGDSCIILKMDSKSFFEAQKDCQSYDQDTDLVVMTDDSLNDFIKKQIKNTGVDFYIGLHDLSTESKFTWVNGEELKPQNSPNWLPGEPNNSGNEDCVEIMYNGKWNDVPCSFTQNFICQRPNDIPLDCDEDNGWVVGLDSCYKFYDSTKTWEDARQYCRDRDSDLMVIGSADEQSVVTSQAISKKWKTFWIGLTDKKTYKGKYQWVDGSSVGTLKNWAVNQPNNKYFDKGGDCVEILDKPLDGKWTTAACTDKRRFTCEKPTGTCAPGWRIHGGYCYQINTISPMTWPASKSTCEAYGGFLVSVTSEDENSFITSQFEMLIAVGIDSLWMGASDYTSDGVFEWSEGSSISFNKWHPTEPKNTLNPDCGNYNTADPQGRWMTGNCYDVQAFICKIRAGDKVWPIDSNTGVGHCQPGWNLFQGNCYFIDSKYIDYATAKKNCEDKNTKLTSILNVDEQSYLSMRTYMFQAYLWIGLNDKVKQGDFVWEDGSPYGGFTNWAPGQPDHYNNNEKCVHFRYGELQEGMWNDLPCGNKQAGYICKTKADCESLLVTTDDIYNYRYHPSVANVDRIEFEVKASRNVYILLSTTSDEVPEQLLYEVVIGDKQNTFSSIRRCKLCKDKVKKATSAFLNNQEFRAFWITYDLNTGVIAVGKKHELAFMTWTDPNPLDVKYVGYSTGAGSHGEFKFCNLYAGVVSTAKPPQTPPFNQRCGSGWEYDPTSNQCYLFRPGEFKTWAESREQCRLGGGDLVSITDLSEQTYINARLSLQTVPVVWIGANDVLQEGGWEWSDGSPFKFINWYPGEPNNVGTSGEHCAELHLATGTWNDVMCTNTMGYICKKDGYLVSHYSVYPSMFLDGVTDQVTVTNVYPDECAKRCIAMTLSSCMSFNFDISKKKCSFLATNKDLIGGLSASVSMDYYQIRNDAPPPTIPATLAPNFRCPAAWQGYTDFCYQTQPLEASWTDARASCRKQGSDLISIMDSNENAFMVSLIEQSIGCRQGWKSFGDYCYFINTKQMTYYDAEQTCEDMGSRLTSIHSYEEQAFLTGEVTAVGTHLWLGLHDIKIENKFAWVDQTPMDFENWKPGQPDNWQNEDCAHLLFISTEAGQWNDLPCSSKAGYICKLRAGTLDTTKFWTGLNDNKLSMTYEWSDDSPVLYTNWAAHEPNNNGGKNEDCVQTSTSGFWSDVDCLGLSHYMCKMKKQDLPPTLVPITPNGCDPSWISYEGSCYKIEDSDKAGFLGAMTNCQLAGGNLVIINDRYEQSLITSQLGLSSGSQFWIGLNDQHTPGYYEWLDGAPLEYSNWGKGQPDDSKGACVFATTGKTAGLWSVYDCSTTMNYICEKRRAGFTTVRVITAPLTTPTNDDCPLDWVGYGSNCYKAFTPSPLLDFWDSENFCKNMGGNLASFHNKNNEDYFIKMANITTDESYWIGFHDSTSEGGFEWTDGSPVEYTNWHDGEPNDYDAAEDCGEMSFNGHGWNDINCMWYQRPAVCMIPKGQMLATTIKPVTYKPCPTGDGDFFLYNHFCYYLSPDSNYLGWKDAEDYCHEYGAHLVSIHDQEEYDFLYNQINRLDIGSFWIGLREYSQSGSYKWSDGTSLDYKAWVEGEPNDSNGEEKCVEMYHFDEYKDGSWNDLNCGDGRNFICKKNYDSVGPITHAPTTPASGYCPYNSVKFLNRCYIYFGTDPSARLSWKDARDECKKTPGTELATIHSQQVQALLTTFLVSYDFPLWIGLSDITNNQQFKWVDGTVVDYTNWGSGEPNEANGEEDCVEMLYDWNNAGRWNDVGCGTLNGYICQSKPDLNIDPPPLVINPCETGYAYWPKTGSCFKIIYVPKDFNDATTACQNLGSKVTLASLNDPYEAAYANSLMVATAVDPEDGLIDREEPLWIGMVDEEVAGEYRWLDGWPMFYTRWDTSEPSRGANEGCVVMGFNGRWNDTTCSSKYRSLCKYSLNPVPTYHPDLPGTCPDTWESYGSSCYYFQPASEDRVTQFEAQLKCMKMGADNLVSVASKMENEFLRKTMRGLHTDSAWLGLHRADEGQFEWLNSDPVNFVYWNNGEPSMTWEGEHENCVEMYTDTGKWNDNKCNQLRSYICKMAKLPPATKEPSFSFGTKSPQKQGGTPTSTIVGIALAATVFILLIMIGIFFISSRNKSPKDHDTSITGFANMTYASTEDMKSAEPSKPEEAEPDGSNA
ncbi:macrophage mannose receptor 1-like [Asterias rubens]|uniref:macrophage mannose receptor 1-like n=1 Tax=Asterias rubens TaxID=7604 RepID=UPI00145515C4|nr:macrophage mannose receptor 1-like [Asterias rubens]